jgi:hypothetical protein
MALNCDDPGQVDPLAAAGLLLAKILIVNFTVI